MSPIHPATARLHDPSLPVMRDLLGDRRPAPLEAVFRDFGSHLISAEPFNVTWWPGSRLTVRFRTNAGGGALSGEREVVASTGEVPHGAVVAESEGGRIGVWAYPHDPGLPGLMSALDRNVVAELVRDLGAGRTVRSLRLRAYRPLRRAVVEVSTGSSRLFLKVVRPSRVAGLHRRHRSLALDLPVPESLGFDAERGIVVLQALRGKDLRRVLMSGDPRLGVLPGSPERREPFHHRASGP